MSLLTKVKETFKGIPVLRDREGRPVFDLRDLPNPVKINPIQRDEPPALPTRPAAPPAIPQDLDEAQATLAALEAAGKKARDRVLLDPALANPPENFSPGAAKNFLAKWVADVESVLRDAQAGKEISLLKSGDVGRVDRSLQGVDRERRGAIEQQRQVIARLLDEQLLREWEPTEAKLRKMDGDIAKTLLKLRDQVKARIAAAENTRRPLHVPARPQLRTIGDSVAMLVRQIGAETDPEYFV